MGTGLGEGSDANVLELDSGDGCRLCEYTKIVYFIKGEYYGM